MTDRDTWRSQPLQSRSLALQQQLDAHATSLTVIIRDVAALGMKTTAFGLVPELALGCGHPDMAGGVAVKQITQKAARASQRPQSPSWLPRQYCRDK